MNPPIEVPPRVELIRGLRIGKGDRQREVPCYLECTDQEGEFLEVRISLDEMVKMVQWLQREKPEWPWKIR